MNVLSLFDGISCAQEALRQAGVSVDKYYASEVDKHVITVTKKNFPDTIQVGGIEDWPNWEVDWSEIDLVVGGSPCQGFSLLGNQLAFDDPRSKLFFELANVIDYAKEHNPNVKFLMENVRMKPDFIEVISGRLGVEGVMINSALISPHHRQRYYWSSEYIKAPEAVETDFSSILEPEDEGYFPAVSRKGSPRPVVLTGGKFACLTATYYKGIRADGRPALAISEGTFDEMYPANEIKRLTPLHCERLQGLPDDYTLVVESGKQIVSNTQRYMALGNGFHVGTIVNIFKQMEITQ